jgi:hypothetical protein
LPLNDSEPVEPLRKDLNAMTRRVTTADADSSSDPGECQESGRHRSVAAASRSAKKITAAPVKAARKAPSTDTGGDADLRQRLAAAEARVKELEGRLASVSDRIAWMADRLHSLLDDGR